MLSFVILGRLFNVYHTSFQRPGFTKRFSISIVIHLRCLIALLIGPSLLVSPWRTQDFMKGLFTISFGCPATSAVTTCKSTIVRLQKITFSALSLYTVPLRNVFGRNYLTKIIVFKDFFTTSNSLPKLVMFLSEIVVFRSSSKTSSSKRSIHLIK